MGAIIKTKVMRNTTATPVPQFGDYWIAEISFFPNNPKHNYVIRLGTVHNDWFYFQPFFDDELGVFESNQVNSIRLIKKVMNWDGSIEGVEQILAPADQNAGKYADDSVLAPVT